MQLYSVFIVKRSQGRGEFYGIIKGEANATDFFHSNMSRYNVINIMKLGKDDLAFDPRAGVSFLSSTSTVKIYEPNVRQKLSLIHGGK